MRARILVAVAALVLLAAPALYLTQPMFFRSRAEVPEVSPARLEAHVRALSERFVPRDFLHPENLDRAAAYVHAEFEAAGGAVSLQDFSAGRATTLR